MKKVGLRNIKTAISVMITMLIINLLGSGDYFYACIAASITMQASVYESFKAGRDRMIGTTIGAIIGVVLAMIQPANILLVGIGIISVIYLCDTFGYKQSISIACIVFIAIMVNLKFVTPLQYGVNRLLETFLGIAVTVIVNYTVFRNESSKKIKKHYYKLKDEINDVFKSVILDQKNKNFDVLKNHITQFQTLINSLEIDCNHVSRNEFSSEIENIREKIELFKEVNIHIKAINYIKYDSNLSIQNKEKLKTQFPELVLEDLWPTEETDEEKFVVYNYHISRIIDIMQEVNEVF